jgi:hypothetical protein
MMVGHAVTLNIDRPEGKEKIPSPGWRSST